MALAVVDGFGEGEGGGGGALVPSGGFSHDSSSRTFFSLAALNARYRAEMAHDLQHAAHVAAALAFARQARIHSGGAVYPS